MDRLKGKTAVVTGASGEIGSAVVETFLKEGASVAAVCGRREGRLEELACDRLRIYHTDVTDPAAVAEMAVQVLEEFGEVDVLVNNAGISRPALFFAMEDEDWEQVIQADLCGPRHVTRQFLLSMVRRKRGSIINMSSVNGIRGNVGQSNYCAAKAGLIGMTKALAREMAAKKIRVNAIAPGYIDTEMVASAGEKQRAQFLASIPMRRLGRPEEVAQAALFLASEEASYITGQVLVVDGGLSV